MLQPIEPWAGTEGTLQVIQQHGEGMAIPVPLDAADITKEAQPPTAKTTKPGGPVCEEVLEVAMVIYLPAPHSKLPLSNRKGIVQACYQQLLLCCMYTTVHKGYQLCQNVLKSLGLQPPTVMEFL